jgi:hypothetical protein
MEDGEHGIGWDAVDFKDEESKDEDDRDAENQAVGKLPSGVSIA